MGGLRASSERLIAAGKRCCNCVQWIDPPLPRPGYCAKCAAAMATHHVHMRFERCLGVWRVRFLASGHSLRELTFADSGKVEELARRGNALRTLADRQGLEEGVRRGLGGIELHLSKEQFDALQARAR